jgi:hypothetical protein
MHRVPTCEFIASPLFLLLTILSDYNISYHGVTSKNSADARDLVYSRHINRSCSTLTTLESKNETEAGDTNSQLITQEKKAKKEKEKKYHF